MKNTPDDEIAAALQGVRCRLNTLACINAENMFIPGGPQIQYHQIAEEAYVARGLIETQVGELRTELEYQYKRVNEAQEGALSEGLTPAVSHLEPSIQVA